MKFAIARGYIVTAQDDGSVGLNARIAAQVDPLAGKQYAELLIHQANAAPDLLEALEEVTRALVEHINIMAKDSNLPPNKVCPCMDNEVSKARKAIAKAKGE